MGDVTPINVLAKWRGNVVKWGMSLQLMSEPKWHGDAVKWGMSLQLMS